MPTRPEPNPTAATTADTSPYFECPIEHISPRRDQPRQHIAPEQLEELAVTIREHGLLQPIVVRRIEGERDAYEIIAGERRWRATQRAGQKTIPIVVKDVDSKRAFEMALVENVQREELNPIEVSEAYQRLIEDHAYTQQSLAERMGKSRTAITNTLRLLNLPAQVRSWINDGTLREGHGRALLGAPDEATMLTIAQKAVRGRYSVRQVEQLVRAAKRSPSEEAGGAKGSTEKSASVRDLELRLMRRIGAKTEVLHKGRGGKLIVRYADLDELDRIIETLGA